MARFLESSPSPRGRRTLRRPRTWFRLEELESRTLLSVAASAYTPFQIRRAYGLDQLGFAPAAPRPGLPNVTIPADGTGQTIAIITAYDNPTIFSDVQAFNQAYNLPTGQGFNLQKATPQGVPTVDKSWALESSLDVEWAHAIAPGANILLVEVRSSNVEDLVVGVDYAVSAGASVVSMSWATPEFATETSAAYDGHFNASIPVTFVASTGDSGGTPTWPAISTGVLAVGGTSLKTNPDGSWAGESAWGAGSFSWLYGGGGGGVSKYEPKPDYQSGVKQSATNRTNPDVAFAADPSIGFRVYNGVNGGWATVGGTSAGAPQWAGLIAIVDQGRALAGKARLKTHDTLSALYNAPASVFHDITTGNNTFPAAAGYDLSSGLGSPKADQLIPYLVGAGAIGIARPPAGYGAPTGLIGPAGKPTYHPVRRLIFVPGELDTRTLVVVVTPAAPTTPTAAAPAGDSVVVTLQAGRGVQIRVSSAAPMAQVTVVSMPDLPPPPAVTVAPRQESGTSSDDTPLLPADEMPDPQPAAPQLDPGVVPDGDGATSADRVAQPGESAVPASAASLPPALLAGDEMGWTTESAAGAMAFALLLAGFRGWHSEDDDER